MSGFCDLHVHTAASDGSRDPAVVVEEAVALDLAAVAVTDHDTLAGVPPALAAARDRLLVVPGVELGTLYRETEVHILGYFVDPGDPGLNGELRRLRDARSARSARMIERLAELGYPLTPEEVARQAGDAAVGRPHVAAALAARGYVRDEGQAFRELLGSGRPAYVPRVRHSPAQAVGLIRSAGGVAVLAHPGLYAAAAAAVLPELVPLGLGGLEVYYPAHDRAMEESYLELCRRFGLVATGGTDYHGPGRHGDVVLGSVGVSRATVEKLRMRSGSGIS